MSSSTEKTFTILYFASASAHTSKTAESLPAPLLLRELFSTLEARYPGFNDRILTSCAVTINLEYVDLEDDGGRMIKENDEVGIIPPVSSG